MAPDGHRRFLWIHGLPGTGKTILASFLIDQLHPFGVSYYYCYEAHKRDETVPFLRWVIRDLCRQLKDRSRPTERLIPQELRLRDRKQLTTKNLKSCLATIVDYFHSQHKKRVYIVVDAVDESPEPRRKFLDVLTTIGTESLFENVSLLMTSRPHPDIKAAIESLSPISPSTLR